MHYANGEEAKVGDLVIGQGYNIDNYVLGEVVTLKEGEETCNLSLMVHATLKKTDAVIKFTVVSPAEQEHGQVDRFNPIGIPLVPAKMAGGEPEPTGEKMPPPNPQTDQVVGEETASTQADDTAAGPK